VYEITEIEIKSLTPLLIGGFDSNYCDKLLRLTAIRGVIRWALRSIVTAAAIKLQKDEEAAVRKVLLYIFGGIESKAQSSRIVITGMSKVKKIDKKRIISNIIDRIDHSRVEFSVDPKKKPNEDFRVRVRYKHQRLNLLWMDLDKKIFCAEKVKRSYQKAFELLKQIADKNREKNRKIKVVWMPSDPKTVKLVANRKEFSRFLDTDRQRIMDDFWEKFKHELLEEISKWIGEIDKATIKIYTLAKSIGLEEIITIYSSIIALLLAGIGKGARRGLGAMKVTNIKIPELQASREELADYIKFIRDFTRDIKEEPKKLKVLIERSIKLAEEILKLGESWMKIKERIDSGMPRIPSIDSKNCLIFIKRTKDLWKEICLLNNKLFTRSGELGRYLRDINRPNQPVKDLKAYILGLPRSARGRGRYRAIILPHEQKRQTRILLSSSRSNKTGFIYSRDEEGKVLEGRRASPIIVSAIDEETIVVSIFKSSDWPDKIYWYTTHNGDRFKGKKIQPLNLVYDDLIKKIKEILKRESYTEISLQKNQ